jgi:plastocyanin
MKKLMFLSALMLLFVVSCEDDHEDEPRPDNEVWMSAHSFDPVSLEVDPGTTIRWVNTSTVTHNVVSGTGLFSEVLNPGQATSFTFNSPGTFNYVCTLHPGMSGSIIVTGDPGGGENGPGNGDDEYDYDYDSGY